MKNPSLARAPRIRSSSEDVTGLTLVELLVVLVILALLAQTAVLSVSGLADQTRREETVNSLEDTLVAVVGDPDKRDLQGHPWIDGFVADVGRLPVATGTEPSQWLQELWNPSLLPPFAIQSPSGDPEVRLPGGWRGPYLRLGLGRSGWFDGWGRAFLLHDPDGLAVVEGSSIAGFSSLGADGIAGGTGYDEDLDLRIQWTGGPPALHLGDVPLRITPRAGVGGNLVVRIYGPVDGEVRTIEQIVVPAADVDVTVLFRNVPVGSRALRVYQTDSTPGSAEDPIAAGIVSRILPLVVVRGGLPEIVVDLS